MTNICLQCKGGRSGGSKTKGGAAWEADRKPHDLDSFHLRTGGRRGGAGGGIFHL